jgi:hypothetical protein
MGEVISMDEDDKEDTVKAETVPQNQGLIRKV